MSALTVWKSQSAEGTEAMETSLKSLEKEELREIFGCGAA
jgi:hypothetical protein